MFMSNFFKKYSQRVVTRICALVHAYSPAEIQFLSYLKSLRQRPLNKIIKTCYMRYRDSVIWKQFRKHFLLNIFRWQLEYVKTTTLVRI